MTDGCNTEQQLHNNKCVPQLVSSFLFVKITEKEQGLDLESLLQHIFKLLLKFLKNTFN